MMRLKYVQALAPWLVTIVLFLVWELSCWLFSVPSFVLPRPSLVFKTMYQFRQQIEYHGLQTLFSTVVGFGLAVAVGLLIGIAVGASRVVYASLYPLLIGFNSIPKVALVPIIVIWFGIGTIPAIITAFSVAFFPLVFAGVLVVGAMGIAMYAICVAFEQRMTKWAFRGSELAT